ncbi:MAG: glycosyltransferase family 4 protein [Ferruginibacter sp.]|nr:glycosyltransferase family 4 protein [Ferruginibacter sp.]
MQYNVLFLTLKIFSATGGIEKVCRIAGKAMYENCTRLQKRIGIMSMHDRQEDAFDNPYFPSEIFSGLAARKARFVLQAVRQGRQSKLVILSHINLLVAGWLIKKISPCTRVVLLAHGIEVWGPLNRRQKMMLRCCDEIVSVSAFTSNKIIAQQILPANKCRVLNNCLDPFLPLRKNVSVPQELYKKYSLEKGDQVLFTLSRLSATERYKGYDRVIDALVQIGRPNIKYLLAGSYDTVEKKYLDEKIAANGLQQQVILAGFVPDEQLAAHFLLGDAYVMPSSKEGFGIVFIEAMYYGLPVVAGNADGSVDALRNGELGLLVDPENVSEIRIAIQTLLEHPKLYVPETEKLMAHFSYDSYKIKLNELLERNRFEVMKKQAMR